MADNGVFARKNRQYSLEGTLKMDWTSNRKFTHGALADDNGIDDEGHG